MQKGAVEGALPGVAEPQAEPQATCQVSRQTPDAFQVAVEALTERYGVRFRLTNSLLVTNRVTVSGQLPDDFWDQVSRLAQQFSVEAVLNIPGRLIWNNIHPTGE